MKIEVIKEKIGYYKEYIRGLIIFDIALISGIATNLYQVFLKIKPFYAIYFSLIGMIVFYLSLVIFYRLHIKIEELLKELEDEL